MENKLSAVRANVGEIETRVEQTDAEIKKVEQRYKGEKEATKARITNLEEELKIERERNRVKIEQTTSDLQSSLNESSMLK